MRNSTGNQGRVLDLNGNEMLDWGTVSEEKPKQRKTPLEIAKATYKATKGYQSTDKPPHEMSKDELLSYLLKVMRGRYYAEGFIRENGLGDYFSEFKKSRGVETLIS